MILREIIINHKKYYDDFLGMVEGISTNILADRLREMEAQDLLTKIRDEDNKRRFVYQPTERALDLVPMLVEMAIWSAKYDSRSLVSEELLAEMTKSRRQTIKAWRRPFENPRTRGKR